MLEKPDNVALHKAPIRRILIANRGEIAIRIARTCAAMGIETVAVFSDADASAPHVRACDRALRIGAAASSASYLNIDAVMDAAARSGADAIHPGYGFLAENAAFARRCAEDGVTFIGPSPEVIDLLGSKERARALAVASGVPVVPGSRAGAREVHELLAAATEIGFPVLIKASMGGGGKGMQVARDSSTFAAMVESAGRVAASAFGDDTLLVERLIESPRHIEVQILGDTHGAVTHLGERECSVQRRYQKVLEEAPAPNLDEGVRDAILDAAVRLARAIGYVGAGTVEFIVAPDGAFYFLEVNTRLQVEHPVTEMTTGIDLVREQIRIAEGAHLDPSTRAWTRRGAAIEARIYAEDPSKGYLPAPGVLHVWRPATLEGVRVDSGVAPGTRVGVDYDPMLAKIIAHGATREEALRRLAVALRRLHVGGVVTNLTLLRRVIDTEAYRRGDVDTGFLERAFGPSPELAPDARLVARAAIVATMVGALRARSENPVLPSLRTAWRSGGAAWVRADYDADGVDGPIAVEVQAVGGGIYNVRCGEEVGRWEVCPDAEDAAALVEGPDGVRAPYQVDRVEDAIWVHGPDGTIGLRERLRFPETIREEVPGGCLAPMPGKVTRVNVAQGDMVARGDVLAVLEAMKMEQPIVAPHDGVVQELRVAEGDQVDGDALIAVVAPAGE